MRDTRARDDRRVAWAGAVLAAGMSVAINVGHAWPNLGFVAYSATLPLLLLVTAEQMARRLLGQATVPVLLLVGACTYSLSAWHTYLMLRGWFEPWPLALAGAVAADVMAVGSVVALYRAGEQVDEQVDADTRTPDEQADERPVLLVEDEAARLLDVHPDSNGHADADIRTLVAVLDGHGGASWQPRADTWTGTDADADTRTPEQDDQDWEAAVWAAYDHARTSERPWTWAQLGEQLGVSPEAARKRAGRRT